MDQINQQFQSLLQNRNFPMQYYEKEEEWIYLGKLSLSDIHVVSFSVSLSKGEQFSIGQIVFQNIGYVKDDSSLGRWFKHINHLNYTKGVFYYFFLDDSKSLSARYVSKVSSDVECFFDILFNGVKLVQTILPSLEEHFGKFVVLK